MWNRVFGLKEEGLTTYLFESEITKALESALPDLTAAGFALSERPTAMEFLERLRRF